ncbi:MAG: hypothetical protein IPP42_14120 [Saprospiraceae bacterium]|nr:hypothetical protein [Saprospiraceae bacterium]
MKIYSFYLFFSIILISNIFGQQLKPDLVAAGAATGKTNNYQLNSSIGEVVTGGFSNSSFKYNQGFQQSGINVRSEKLPGYEIGLMPTFSVHSDIETAFYVKSDSLGKKAIRSILLKSTQFKGYLNLNPTIGKFAIIPAKTDKDPVIVTFKAKLDKDSVTQEVIFNVSPTLKDEHIVFGLEPFKNLPDDADDDYIIETSSKNLPEEFNGKLMVTKNISIAGKSLIFDKSVVNKLQNYITNQTKDIKELNIYAETVIIRNYLNFFQTNILIHAKTLIFEQRNLDFPCLSTTPDSIHMSAANNMIAKNGIKAGNITLFVNEIISDPGIHFVLNGSNGQSSIEGSGGDGGPGGSISSNIELNGSFNIQGGAGGKGIQNVIQGVRGSGGGYSLNEFQYLWLHPNYLRMVLEYAKSVYLNGYLGNCEKICDYYIAEINLFKSSSEWVQLGDQDKRELEQIVEEMQTLKIRIGNNLDYFGNPAGWVPMLTFEINKLAFDKEVERSMNILYLTYKAQKIDSKNEDKIAMLGIAKKEQENRYSECRQLYEESATLIPTLKQEAQKISDHIDQIKGSWMLWIRH